MKKKLSNGKVNLKKKSKPKQTPVLRDEFWKDYKYCSAMFVFSNEPIANPYTDDKIVFGMTCEVKADEKNLLILTNNMDATMYSRILKLKGEEVDPTKTTETN